MSELTYEELRPYTLLSPTRLYHFGDCIKSAVADEIPGDVIETGVWKGGACIYARSVLSSLGDRRVVYAADSFEGFPDHSKPYLAVSLSEVRENFGRFGFLDRRTKFVKGWFTDTLPKLKGSFSVLRLDADLYDSTMQALEHLYPKLSPGGFLIQDDYYNLKYPGARQAIDEWLHSRPYIAPIPVREDRTEAIFWRKGFEDAGAGQRNGASSRRVVVQEVG